MPCISYDFISAVSDTLPALLFSFLRERGACPNEMFDRVPTCIEQHPNNATNCGIFAERDCNQPSVLRSRDAKKMLMIFHGGSIDFVVFEPGSSCSGAGKMYSSVTVLQPFWNCCLVCFEYHLVVENRRKGAHDL